MPKALFYTGAWEAPLLQHPTGTRWRPRLGLPGEVSLGGHVEAQLTPYQTVVTEEIANWECIYGIEVVVQQPARHEEEMAYLQTMKESYDQMAKARERVLELAHHLYTTWLTRSARNLRLRLCSIV